ncbi:LolA-related protein [Uliginosibacterium sp. H3]|uniref:LolA-related protein n=1 Tax=Uliginosibacterium silvisoli TaxID=3114758 RepID=A0ABU6JYG1_9RHOO|nr:LolA-related protein [Uliginosibacterium sp. H3]
MKNTLRQLRLVLALLCTLGLLPLQSVSAASWQLPDLMKLLAETPAGRATFVEQKFIGMLDKPVVSSGELSFTAPDQLEKRTLKPRPEALILKGDELTLERGKRSMKMSLQEHPEVSAFVESIRATLAGDQRALERVWKVALDGAPNRWALVLTPLSPGFVAQIRIDGVRGEVRQIDIEQSDGDRSIMTISKVLTP